MHANHVAHLVLGAGEMMACLKISGRPPRENRRFVRSTLKMLFPMQSLVGRSLRRQASYRCPFRRSPRPNAHRREPDGEQNPRPGICWSKSFVAKPLSSKPESRSKVSRRFNEPSSPASDKETRGAPRYGPRGASLSQRRGDDSTGTGPSRPTHQNVRYRRGGKCSVKFVSRPLYRGGETDFTSIIHFCLDIIFTNSSEIP